MNDLLSDQTERVRRLAGHLQGAEGGPVNWLQTHISHVLLTPLHAYKIKKAVNLGFADFRALGTRLQACMDEVRLNRRTAAGLYLGVAGISTEGRLVPASTADETPPAAADYAVRMRRFEPGARFDELLAAGQLTPQLIDELTDAVVRLHGQAPTVIEADCGTPQDMRRASGENIEQLLQLAEDADEQAVIQAYGRWSAAQEEQLQAQFEARRQDGCVRDVHGDLHLANVCLFEGRATLFDCLEFDRHLRCIDVINDLAFLVMDLHARGAAPYAWRVLNRYLEATGDYAALPLLRYYMGYRAAVRLKVARLSRNGTAQEPPQRDDSRRYLALLRALPTAPARAVVITHGVSGSGKTALSQQLLEQLGAVRVRADVERKRLHAMGALQRAPEAGLTQAALYSPEATARTYARLAEVAGGIAAAGYVAVADATFLHPKHRAHFRALAARLGLPFAIVHCEAPVELLRQRVSRRAAAGNDASDAGLEVLASQLAGQAADPAAALSPQEMQATVVCDSTQPLAHWASPQAWQSLIGLLHIALEGG